MTGEGRRVGPPLLPGGYGGWMPDGRAADPFGLRAWLMARLPTLEQLYLAARPAAQRRREIAAARRAERRTDLGRARHQIDTAIAELEARGIRVAGRVGLVTWLAEGLHDVARGRAGFDLTAPPLATRVFAGGALVPPGGSDGSGGSAGSGGGSAQPAVLARDVAAVVASYLSGLPDRPVDTVSLEGLPDAGVIDRLDLADWKIRTLLAPAIATVVDQRPDLAPYLLSPAATAALPPNERPKGAKGLEPDKDVDPGILADRIWREGLCRQYAREAAAELVFIVPAGYEGHPVCTSEIPELLGNSRVSPADAISLGATHFLHSLGRKTGDDFREYVARKDAADNNGDVAEIESAGFSARTGPHRIAAPDGSPIVDVRTLSYAQAVQENLMWHGYPAPKPTDKQSDAE